MGNGKHGQRGIMVNTADRDWAPWEMGHMGDGAHGHNLGHMAIANMVKGVSWLILDRDGAPWGMGHMGDEVHGQ